MFTTRLSTHRMKQTNKNILHSNHEMSGVYFISFHFISIHLSLCYAPSWLFDLAAEWSGVGVGEEGKEGKVRITVGKVGKVRKGRITVGL